ncbi:MAG: extracellular solute-binding protein [Chloroflexaceae bacterium]|nr:extracellular solute-binding protein [Chloroflexaceae bacterium]
MQRHPVLSLILMVLLVLSACGSDAEPPPLPETGEPSSGTVANPDPTNPTPIPANPTPIPAPDMGSPAGDSGSGSAGDGGPVTIGFGVMEFQRQTYEPLVESFNQENPDMQVQIVPLDQVFHLGTGRSPRIEEMMQQIVSAADTAMPLVPIRPEDIQNGYLQDLKPLMDADPQFDRSDFYPNALAPMSEDGGLYLLPELLPVPVLSYNKSLWATSGLPAPAADWTWDDLTAAAEQMARKRGDTVETYGMLLGGGGTIELLVELDRAGADMFVPMEQVTLNTPEVEAAIEQVKSLSDSGAIYVNVTESGVVEFGTAEARDLIREGRIGIWQPGMLQSGPDTDALAPDFEEGTMMFPTEGVPSFFFGTPMGYIMSSGTRHPQEAWRWLSFLSRQYIDQPFSGGTTVTQISARRSLAERSGYWNELDEETAAVVRATLEHPAASLPPGIQNDINEVMQILRKAQGAVLSGQQDTRAALQDAQSELVQRVAELQLTPEPTPQTGPIVVATLEPEAEPVQAGAAEITFATFWFGADDLRRLAKEFNEQHPDIFVRINNITALQEMPEFADIADENDCFYWLGEPSAEDLKAAALDIKPLIDADATFNLNDYPAAFLAAYQQGPALYGLPYAVNLPVLSYNQTAFDDLGMEYPSIAWTLDDFMAAAERLDSGGDEASRRYGYAENSTMLMYFLQRAGALPTQGSGDSLQPVFTDPQVVEGIQFYLDLLRNYSPHKELNGYRQGTWSSEAFQLTSEGRIGMWIQGGVFVFGGNRSRGFTQAVAPPPLGGTMTAEDVSVRGFHISATTDQAGACWEWIRSLSNDTSMLQNAFPARLSAADSPAFAEENAQAGTVEVFRAYREVLKTMPAGSVTQPDRSQMDNYWLIQAADRALQGGDLVRELEAAQQTTEQFLACVRTGEEKSTCATQVDPDYKGFNVPEEDEEGEGDGAE